MVFARILWHFSRKLIAPEITNLAYWYHNLVLDSLQFQRHKLQRLIWTYYLKIFYKTSFLPWIFPVCMSVHPCVNNFLELSTCFISLRALVFCPHSRQVWSGFGGLKISGPSQASHFRACNQKSLTDVFTQWVGYTQNRKYKKLKNIWIQHPIYW